MDWKKIWEASKWPMIAGLIFSIALIVLPVYDTISQLPIFWIWLLVTAALCVYAGYTSAKKYSLGYSEAVLSAVILSAVLLPSAIVVSYAANLVPGINPSLAAILFSTPIYFTTLVIPLAVTLLLGAFIAKKLK